MIVTTCCLAMTWGCARNPQVEESAELTEQIAEVLPDQPSDPPVVLAAPEWATTVFANRWTDVAHVALAPDELIPPHAGGVRYVYALSQCTLSVVRDGEKELVHLEPHEFTMWPAGRLSLANVDDTVADLLLIERTPIETSPELETLAIPDSTVEMERHGTVLLDDDQVVAVEVSLDELQSEPLSPNLPTLTVALGESDLEYQGDAVPDTEHLIPQGEAVWQPAGYNAVTNIGQGPARVLVVSFRV
jgi:hypothetical protein